MAKVVKLRKPRKKYAAPGDIVIMCRHSAAQ
eukprot:CAMPEP_0204445366 /NCGR_PEP_ID=MMETSP0470-20130426/92739_1 /ASSEMBLY_ACC=CAM_ASM_000385 /TAXON_ID=2969 /ORGANISM="Oxyrrhis marina" /LENGTH=30 /DNA_ID= /DNA_START= /DNA_END= /DNA_ORIENTATION=